MCSSPLGSALSRKSDPEAAKSDSKGLLRLRRSGCCWPAPKPCTAERASYPLTQCLKAVQIRANTAKCSEVAALKVGLSTCTSLVALCVVAKLAAAQVTHVLYHTRNLASRQRRQQNSLRTAAGLRETMVSVSVFAKLCNADCVVQLAGKPCFHLLSAKATTSGYK